MTLNDVVNASSTFVTSFFGSFEIGLKMLFQDIVVLNVPLGWWFVIFMFVGFLVYKIGEVLNG